jgi:hypothetical protein
MVKLIKVTMHSCTCDLCGHEWIARLKPERCASCKRFGWDNGGLTRSQLRRAQIVLDRPATRPRASKRD